MLRKKIVYTELRASFTIESAVVVPLCMVMLVTIIYTAFFVHNAATIAAITDYAILEQASGTEENRDAFCQGAQELLAERLIGETASSVSISGDETNRNAYASAEFQIPLNMIDELTGRKMGSLSFRTEISNLNGRKTLLLYKSICDGVSDLFKGH